MNVLNKKICENVFILKEILKLKSENNNLFEHKIQNKDEIRYLKYKNVYEKIIEIEKRNCIVKKDFFRRRK